MISFILIPSFMNCSFNILSFSLYLHSAITILSLHIHSSAASQFVFLGYNIGVRLLSYSVVVWIY